MLTGKDSRHRLRHSVGAGHNFAPKSEGCLARLLVTVFSRWQRIEHGYVARIDWPAAYGGKPTHEFLGSVRRTPRSAQAAADRLWAYWAKSPAQPDSVRVVFISSAAYRAHWELHPCSADNCNGEP